MKRLRIKDPNYYDDMVKRFMCKFVVADDGCWNWIAGQLHKGYGGFAVKGRTRAAHRFSYEYFKGKIPDGLTIDHLCRNHGCVNPEHLEAVTMKENVLRGIGASAKNRKKVFCKHGHQFEEGNILYRISPDGTKWRSCKKCASRLSAEYYIRRKTKELK